MTDIRVTTFNASLNRSTEGELAAQLADPGLASEAQLANLTGAAETIQRLNPDVLLVNEFDVDLTGQAAQDFQDNFLSVGQNGADPIDFPYVYVADSNTGRLTGFDKNNDGIVATEADLGSFTYANDSHGFGQFPGQFGYVIYSKYPILTEEIRTFQDFLWADMPGALLFDTEMGRPLFDPERPFDAEDPNNEDTSFFTEEEANGFFLSAKNHVDLPVDVNGETVHILAAHPTPPVFDGPEDLNGKLNHDEIRFWTDYVNGEDYIYDDEGVSGGLEEGARFVIVGDYNADPNDGDSVPGAADQFLQDPLIDTTITPTSEGAVAATERQGADNETHVSDPAADTADFGESPFGPGNIRVDYALPSRSGLALNDASVFWPTPEEEVFDRLTGDFPFPVTDHRPVSVDLTVEAIVDDASLPEGVASGDVSEDSVVLWTRSTEPGTVTFETYAVDAGGIRSLVDTQTAEATEALVPVLVTVEDLDPLTDYEYVVTNAVGAEGVGRFTTAADDGFNGLNFGVTGDWRGELSPYPAVANAPGEELDFFVYHGDTIYADFESPVNPGVEQAETLDDFRVKYTEVYGERGGANFFRELREATPSFATIDDHEVTNDFAGGATIGETAESEFRDLFPGDDPEALVNDATLYENGLQAWQEYHPIAEEFYGDTGDERTAGERQLYRGQAFGDDAAIMVLDQRSFRDEQIDGVADITDVADLVRFQTESLDPTRTLLGEAQLQDLFDDLLAAEQRGVTWKFIMTPEPFQNLGLNNADSWEGYQGERVEILQFIEENSIDNVVFVAADIHATFVNQITYSEVPFGEQIETPHFEITTGSVAFDPPFGPAIVEVAFALGLIDEATFGFYNSLPIAPDDDDNPLNDRDGFVEDLFNTVTLTPNGLSPLGLDDASLIDATLVEGGWTSAHTYGWTDFDIDPETQALTVTTWGLDFYTEDEALADPEAIAALEPRIVSQFTVEATLDPTTEATTARETFEATEAANDVFVFTPESTAPRSRGERIEEFEAGDRIDLTAFGFEDIEIGRPVRGDTDTLFLREIRDDVLLTGGDGFALRVEGDIDDIVAGILLAEPEL